MRAGGIACFVWFVGCASADFPSPTPVGAGGSGNPGSPREPIHEPDLGSANAAPDLSPVVDLGAAPDLSSATLGCASRPMGLISWWQAESTAYDWLGVSNAGVFGSVGYAPGEVGSAFSLVGQGYVVTASSPSLTLTGPFTVEAWVQPTTAGQTQRIVDKITAYGSDGYLLDLSVGRLRVIAGTQLVTGATLIPAGVFTHVAGVFTGSSLAVYVNGVLDGLKTVPQTPIRVGTQAFRIGADSTGKNQFKGLIDEVSLYGRAVAPSELQAIVAAGSAGKCQ
jgi:hypothetical protein